MTIGYENMACCHGLVGAVLAQQDGTPDLELWSAGDAQHPCVAATIPVKLSNPRRNL